MRRRPKAAKQGRSRKGAEAGAESAEERISIIMDILVLIIVFFLKDLCPFLGTYDLFSSSSIALYLLLFCCYCFIRITSFYHRTNLIMFPHISPGISVSSTLIGSILVPFWYIETS